LVERIVYIDDVGGSSPSTATVTNIKENNIVYTTIGRFNLRNLVSVLQYSNINGPYPIIKKFEGGDIKKMKAMGVLESMLKPGEFVVIGREKKLV